MSQTGAEKTETSANRAGHKLKEWDYINESHYESPAETLDQSCMMNFGSREIHAVNGTEINTTLLFPHPPYWKITLKTN